MDLGTDAGRDTGPVGDARATAEVGGPPWRPWWVVFSSWGYAAWALVQLAIITTLAFANAGRRAPAETTVLTVFSCMLALLWVGGVAVLVLRPQVARRPTRPHSAAARSCLIAAGVIAVAGYFGVLLLASRSTPGVLAAVAVSIFLIVPLTISARRIDDRAEAAGRLPAGPADSSFAG